MKASTQTLVTFIAVCAAVFFALCSASDRFELKRVAAEAREFVAETRTAIKSIEEQNAALARSNESLSAERDAYKREADVAHDALAAEADAREHDALVIADLKQRLATAQPSELLRVTREILATDEVTLSYTDARFSLAAFRTNSVCLVEWRDFKFTLVPSLERSIVKHETQATALTNALDKAELELKNKDTILANAAQASAKRESIIAAKDTQLRISKRTATRDKVFIALISLALGYAAGK